MESKNNTVPRTAVLPQWDRSVHRLGITTLIIAMALSFGPFLYLYIKYGVRPSFGVLMTAWANVAVAYGAMYIIEPLSYFPSLGTSGSYMGWLAGSVSQMRVTSSVVAKEITGVEDGTQEAEVVSTAAIAGSIVINIVVLTVGAIAGYQILALLPPVVQDALNEFIVPSIFGAVLAMVGASRLLLTIPVFLVLLVVNYGTSAGWLPIPSWAVLVVAVFGTILYARVLYKKGKLH